MQRCMALGILLRFSGCLYLIAELRKRQPVPHLSPCQLLASSTLVQIWRALAVPIHAVAYGPDLASASPSVRPTSCVGRDRLAWRGWPTGQEQLGRPRVK